MTPILINDWYATTRNGPYSPPECGAPCVGGILASDHPRGAYRAGDAIHTSAIVSVEGRIVTTRGGTRYELGTMSASYQAWLAEHDHECDPAQPLRLRAQP